MRVLLADDNPEMLSTAVEELGSEFLVVGSYTEGESVLVQVPIVKPDVIVLDISMHGISGFEVALRLRSTGCAAKVVFLTVHEEQELITAAQNLGVDGYVFKSLMSQDLVRAIHAVMNGDTFISRSCEHVKLKAFATQH